MGLKILHSADWHLDSPFARFLPEQQAYLAREQRRIPGIIAELARREGCDLVLLSGDLFDGPYTKKTAAIVASALESCGVPVLIAPGNHDFLCAGSPWVEENWPENVHIFSEELSCVTLPGLDCRVYGAGYRSMDCPPLLEHFRAEGSERYRLAVLHADPMRMHSPYCPVTAAQVRDSGLDYLALGHIHKAGSFRTPRTLCGWPGAPMGRGFDETGDKGVYIVELEEDAKITFIPLDTPRFFDLEVDTDTCTPEEILPPGKQGDFFRVTLTGSGGPPLEQLREDYLHIPNLEWVDLREDKREIWDQVDEDTLEGCYFRLLREKMEHSQGQEAQTIRLAAEISKRILEGREVAL